MTLLPQSREYQTTVIDREKSSNLLSGLDPENPHARIYCIIRRNVFTACDGTCSGCKKRRQEFLTTEPSRMRTNDLIQSGGDPEVILGDMAHYRQILTIRINKWHECKIKIIQTLNEQKRIEKLTDDRLVLLKKLASPSITIMPESPLLQ